MSNPQEHDVRMKRRYYDTPPREDIVAGFGQACLVKTPEGKLEIRGGTPEEQAQARKWQAMFLTDASKKTGHRP